MEDTIRELLNNSVKKFGVFIDSVVYEKEAGINYLRIAIDKEEIIPLDVVVKVTRAINPILDKADLIDEEYILDVYAKPKGDVK